MALNITHRDDVFEGDFTQPNDALGDMGHAKEYYERHLGVYRKKPGSQRVDVANCLKFLGTVLHDQGDLEKAKSIMSGLLLFTKKGLVLSMSLSH